MAVISPTDIAGLILEGFVLVSFAGFHRNLSAEGINVHVLLSAVRALCAELGALGDAAQTENVPALQRSLIVPRLAQADGAHLLFDDLFIDCGHPYQVGLVLEVPL